MKNFLREMDTSISRFFSPVVKWIVYLCVGVFVFLMFASAVHPAAIGFFYHLLGASVLSTILHFQIWQLFTYAFVHASFGHLFFNLLGLYFFGQRLEFRWGSAQFARFCVIVGAGAVLTHLLVVGLLSAFTGASTAPVIIGISGVVYGVMLACAMYYPDDIVYFQFLVPIKLKYLVAIMAVLTFISASRQQGQIAHLTHLGGFLFAFLYIKVPVLFDWIPTVKHLPWSKKPKYVDPRERWRRR